MEQIKELIVNMDDFLKTFDKKFVYCGSMSLYLNGMDIEQFNDADIDFIDTPEEEKIFIWTLDSPLKVDKLSPLKNTPIQYREMDFFGRKMFVSTLEYELKARERLLRTPNYWFKEKVSGRIEDIKDYLNIHNYGKESIL